MARPQQLESLLRHAQMQEQQAQSKWLAAQQQFERHSQQLSDLKTYLTDYAPARLQHGVAASVLLNHSRFSERLRAAIVQQTQVVSEAQLHCDKQREHWQHKRRRLEALDALKQQRVKEKTTRQTRVEQRSLDDFALRSLQLGWANAG